MNRKQFEYIICIACIGFFVWIGYQGIDTILIALRVFNGFNFIDLINLMPDNFKFLGWVVTLYVFVKVGMLLLNFGYRHFNTYFNRLCNLYKKEHGNL